MQFNRKRQKFGSVTHVGRDALYGRHSYVINVVKCLNTEVFKYYLNIVTGI